MPADLIASLSHNAHGFRAVTSRSIVLYSTVNRVSHPGYVVFIIYGLLNWAEKVVQISKTAHPIAKLITKKCLPCACNHQKSNWLSELRKKPNFTHRCSSIGQRSGSNQQNRTSDCKTSYINVFGLCLKSSENQLADDSCVLRK